jgi:hypothetical protein
MYVDAIRPASAAWRSEILNVNIVNSVSDDIWY